MSGEIKRDGILESVQNYLGRLQAITSGVLSLNSTGTRNKLLEILTSPGGTSNIIKELWKGLKNNFGGIENGTWRPSITTTNTSLPQDNSSPEQLQRVFNSASQKAIETSMQALGIKPSSNLPQLLNQYGKSVINTDDAVKAGIQALGINLPQLSSAISPAVSNVMSDATQQMRGTMASVLSNVDTSKSATSGTWVIREDPFEGTVNKTQDMQELFGTEGRFESAFDLSNTGQGESGLQIESLDGSLELAAGTMLTLEEQKTLAAYALYSAPKFYIPPMLVVNDEAGFQSLSGGSGGTSDLRCFIFLSIGNLSIEDATYPRNVPILKVPDADIDAVQDLGFGSGTIKISGVLWGEAGYVRLQSLRELCKTRRALIWTAQETGAWLVFPQNVPGINTSADIPGQYHFEFTLICVGKLKEDGKVKAINKQRMLSVERKFKQESAILANSKNQFKLFSSLANSELNLGYVWDPAVGGYTQSQIDGPSLGEIIPDPEIAAKSTGVGSPVETDRDGDNTPLEFEHDSPQETFPAIGDEPVPDSEFDRNREEFRRRRMEELEKKRDELDEQRKKAYEEAGMPTDEEAAETRKAKEVAKAAKEAAKSGGVGGLLDKMLNSETNTITPFFTTATTNTTTEDLPLDAYTFETIKTMTLNHNGKFANKALSDFSPSELYYWVTTIEESILELREIHPDVLSDEILSSLGFEWNLQDYTVVLSLDIKILDMFFEELAKRGLPQRDAKQTPSELYAGDTYYFKKLSQYYKASADIARRQGTAPSRSTKPSRHPTTIDNNVLYKKKTPHAPSLKTIKTTTNTNRWVKPKTKTLKRPDE